MSRPMESSGRGRGRGRGLASGGARGRGSVPAARPPWPVPPPAPEASSLTAVPASATSAFAPSSSTAPPPDNRTKVPASPISAFAPSSSTGPPLDHPSTVEVEALSHDMEKTLALQPTAPSSSKAVRFPDRPGYGTIGRKILVRANHFLVKVAECDLHHYDVSITPEVASKSVNRALMQQLIQLYQDKDLGRRIPAYDGRKSLFTAGPLPFTSKDFVVKLVDKDVQDSSARKKREREFKVTIRQVTQISLYNLQQFLSRQQLECPQETIQALDVVLRATPSLKYSVVGRSFFSPQLGPRGTLGSGTEYWRGYYQSLRPTQMGLSLNIDVSSRAYYEPIPVIDFIEKHFRVDLRRPLSDQNRVKIRKTLRGVKVVLVHNQPRSYKITGISKDPLSELTFKLDDQSTTTSVVHYFHERYGKKLKYTSLPALQAGNDARPVYLPMELCHIADGQRYTKRLNEEQVTNLLRATCQRPRERENDIRRIVRENNFSTDNFVHEFGIEVSQEPVMVNARVLPAPMLKYHDTGKESKVSPIMGQWNMINKKMIDGGLVRHWCCINFSSRVNRDFPRLFCDELVNMCTSKGMSFNPNPVVQPTLARANQIRESLLDVQKNCMAQLSKQNERLQLLIIILPDSKGSYETIKRICETELGIVSQCCQPSKAMKMQKQYLENVALKINVKVGGKNTVLQAALDRNIPLVTDKPTIILGADVTHPQPGEDSSPSIAAVVASMDWPHITKYRGAISAQNHREEIIQDLYKSHVDPKRGVVHGGMIRELLRAFYKATNFKPDRIIFYRDGVSEGQFSQVLLYEMDAIRKACVSIQENYLPKVTFIVVQKRHHTRLFPAQHGPGGRDTDKSGNIQPGTIVETGICHPREYDFYLNSHAGIQGTSRPTHYHVLFDENRFSADHLQTLTNNLCYTYARCTRSVSIVPPAYYAHLLAFRARYYMEGENSDVESGGRRSINEIPLPAVMDNVKEVMFYC